MKISKNGILCLGFCSIILLLTAGECDTVSSGEEEKTGWYTFKSVKLTYDLSSYQNSFQDLAYDLGELHTAHGCDPTKLSGAITKLNNILLYEKDYPSDRKPKVEIIVKHGPDVYEYECTSNDLGDNWIGNIPYAGMINSLIINVKSITTESHGVCLYWSKTFDLNDQWWDYYDGDKHLAGAATVTVAGYSKVTLPTNTVLIREYVGDRYNVISSSPDVDISSGESRRVIRTAQSAVTSPVLSKAVYINGKINNSVSWKEPVTAMVY